MSIVKGLFVLPIVSVVGFSVALCLSLGKEPTRAANKAPGVTHLTGRDLIGGPSDEDPLYPLVFRPATLRIAGMKPGLRHTSVLLRNDGDQALSGLQIEATCGCVDFPSGRRVGRLDKGRSIVLPITVQNDSLSDLDQVVTIRAKKRGTTRAIVATLPVSVRMLTPFANPGQKSVEFMPALRGSPGMKARSPRLILPLVPGSSSVSIKPDVSWLKVESQVSQGRLAALFEAVPGAPEGPFLVSGSVRYRVGENYGETSIPLKGAIASAVRVTPSRPSFGVIPVGTQKDIDVSIDASGLALEEPIRIVSDEPALSVVSRSSTKGVMVIRFRVRPTLAGNLDGHIRVLSAGKDVAAFELDGFVVGKST